MISRLLKERRGEIQLATNIALVGSPAAGYADVRGDPAYVKQAAEESLRRLGTDVIDLYYMHRRDLRGPIVETVEAMSELVQRGKVRHLGLSEVTAEELREAHSIRHASSYPRAENDQCLGDEYLRGGCLGRVLLSPPAGRWVRHRR